MAKWTNYFKIVEPKSGSLTMADNQNLGDQGSYGNYTWYQRLVQGSAARLTKYREYDLMDNDIEVSRALDIIAEEMTGNDSKSDMPLELDITSEDEDVENNTVLTLKAALQHWSRVHQWDNRLFKIARNMAKYGDCFFQRQTESKKWVYLHPRNVIGAIVSEDDVTSILGWQIKAHPKKAKATWGAGSTGGSQEIQTKVVPREDIVRFTLNDDMSDSAPFGESVLSTVYRAYKQKELIEDAIIIYRVQRAPERRVFYIDVGKMPPQRVKTYLEGIKNEIKQKKIPTQQGGQSQIESVYNPQSMSEDFFFAQRADGRGSRVETLPGGAGLGELADLEYFQDKVWRGLRIPISYMRQGAEGAIFNDGKVGVAYQEELQFALYIERLQGHVESTLDHEFKKYMRKSNINIEESLYRVVLPEPTNFQTYRQQEVDAALLSSYGTADGVPYLSKRFILERYLQLTEEDIVTNENLLREEKGLDTEGDDMEKDLPIIYNPEAMEAMEGGEGLGEPEEMTAGGGEDLGAEV